MADHTQLDPDRIPTLDQNVKTAFLHWSHRFIASGVPLHDFEMITSGLYEWRDWRQAWSRQGALHEELGKGALGQGRNRTAGEHLQRAALMYHFGKFLLSDDDTQMKLTHDKSLECHRLALAHLDPPGEREEIPFEDDQSLPGILRKPIGVDRPPLVIMCSGLDACKEEMGAHETGYLSRGVATLAFDGPGQGEVAVKLPLRPDFKTAVAAVLDYVQNRADINPGRVGVWGAGLGGQLAVRAAILDDRIRACVSISGAFDYGTEFNQMPSLWRDVFRHRTHSADEAAAKKAAQQFNLALVGERITCPLLVLAGDSDEITPPENSEQIMSLADGLSRFLLILDGGHMVDNRRYSYGGQTSDWMAEVLTI